MLTMIMIAILPHAYLSIIMRLNKCLYTATQFQTPSSKRHPTLTHPESTLDGALSTERQIQSSHFPRTPSEDGILGSITSDGAAMQGKSCSLGTT